MQTQAVTRDSLDAASIQFVDIDGIRTRYFDGGSGPTVLLLSGGQPGLLYSLDQWSLNLPELTAEHRVIALDKLGQGHTANPKSDNGYRFNAVVEHAIAFLDALHAKGAHLVGHSRGGLLACLIAHRRPDLVKSLTIVDSASTADVETTDDAAVYARLGLLDGWDPELTPTLDTVAIEPRGQSSNPDTVTGDFLERLLEIAELEKVPHAMRRMSALAESQWVPSINAARQENYALVQKQGFNVPVLVVWGRNDLTAPLLSGLKLYDTVCERTEHAEMHVLNRAGHCSFRDQAASFNAVLSDFIRRV